MKRWLLLLLCSLSLAVSAQEADSTRIIRIDSVAMAGHPYFSFTNPVRRIEDVRRVEGREEVFYSLVALLLFFAAVRNGFYRYMQDLLRIFSGNPVRQRQIRENLLQSPLPSLLLNIFFLFSAALFLTLLARYFGLARGTPFPLLFLYALVGLAAAYLLKFFLLKVLGWIFSISDAMDSYIFIVFTTAKVIGMVLIPFLILLAFSGGPVLEGVVAASGLVIGGLFVYRFYLSYTAIHRQVRIDPVHFLLYVLAFEVAPLLVINKLLLRYLA